MKLRHSEKWKGEYDGVEIEIAKWEMGWNYYIYLPVKQIPDEMRHAFELTSTASYDTDPIISELDWHGGITYLEKIRDRNGKVIVYEMGCDYMHAGDLGTIYTLSDVLQDAKHSVDKLLELVPNLKAKCLWSGEYYPREEMVEIAGGRVARVYREKLQDAEDLGII